MIDHPDPEPVPERDDEDAADAPAPARESDALGLLQAHVEPDVWATLVAWRAVGRRVALLTVVETRGMTPRKTGARMLMSEDGAISGTIGGGTVEHMALTAARETMAAGERERSVTWQLTQELGMCCGGEMSLRIEILEPPPALVVFGAGYVGRALALLALGCGFRVTVVDDRPEWGTPARLPGANVVTRDPEHFARQTPPGPRDYVVVATHQHALDQRLIETLLQRPPRFLGMIGSLAKQRKFALRLEAKGFGDDAIARLRSPLGLSIGAETPEEIAVSVMAELVAVRRGVEVGPAGAPPRRHEGSRRAIKAGATSEDMRQHDDTRKSDDTQEVESP